MVFSSLIFLFLFLPVFLAAYYLTPARWRSLTILAGSYIFYAWWRVDFLLLLVGVTYWNYFVSKRILKHLGPAAPEAQAEDDESAQKTRARRWMQLGVFGNLLCLGIFKYFNFGVDSLNAVLGTSGLQTMEALRFILPIGISFYIFQSISYLIDIYRKDAPPPEKFMDFAAFISLFPQLIAGPVLRYKDLADQFHARTHNFEKFSHGAYRFMGGFVQKVLIADSVADLVDKSFALEDPSMADAWLGALAYTVQLYYDFCGYSNMAIGLGLMMGFKFIENFNHPYISRSITEFWRRWHISLSAWLRDYLYIPLGGNRKGAVRTYVNLFLTMLLGGLWHGANWTFIIWGAWHGGILAIERFFGQRKKPARYIKPTHAPPQPAPLEAGNIPAHASEALSSPPSSAATQTAPDTAAPAPAYLWQGTRLVLTFLAVLLGWVMFRAVNVGQALDFYGAMFGASGLSLSLSDALGWQITGVSITALIGGLGWAFLCPLIEKKNGKQFKESRALPVHAIIIALFLLSVVKLGAQSYSPFLYFQF